MLNHNDTTYALVLVFVDIDDDAYSCVPLVLFTEKLSSSTITGEYSQLPRSQVIVDLTRTRCCSTKSNINVGWNAMLKDIYPYDSITTIKKREKRAVFS